MAVYTWVSTTGDVNAAGSFSPAGGPPTSGDSLQMTEASQQDVLNVPTGLAISDWIAYGEYDGDIGDSGAPAFQLAARLIFKGSGAAWARGADPGAYNLYLCSFRGGTVNWGNSLATSTQRLFVTAGTLNVTGSDGNANTDIFVVPAANASAYLSVLPVASAAVPRYYQTGGDVVTPNPLGSTECVISGGTLEYSRDGTATWAKLTMTGGYVFYNGSGALTTAIILGGTLDMTQDRRAKTITTLVLGPNATYLDHSGITVTTQVDLRDTLFSAP